MTTHARGSFEVDLQQQAQDSAEGTMLGRMSIDKRFSGDIEATSKGEMLTAGAENGSAVYVAIERVSGTLHGRSGSFVLVHNGAMASSGQSLSISVMPDSGTGELAGIAGNFALSIVDGKHLYDLAYTLGSDS